MENAYIYTTGKITTLTRTQDDTLGRLHMEATIDDWVKMVKTVLPLISPHIKHDVMEDRIVFDGYETPSEIILVHYVCDEMGDTPFTLRKY